MQKTDMIRLLSDIALRKAVRAVSPCSERALHELEMAAPGRIRAVREAANRLGRLNPKYISREDAWRLILHAARFGGYDGFLESDAVVAEQFQRGWKAGVNRRQHNQKAELSRTHSCYPWCNKYNCYQKKEEEIRSEQ